MPEDLYRARPNVDLLIGGVWCGARDGRTKSVLNPATEEVVCDVAYGGAADCHAAIDAARAAFPGWSSQTPYYRAAVLKQTAELIRGRADTPSRTRHLSTRM